MTAQGSAVTRLYRVLDARGTSAWQVRVAASELAQVGLEDALAIVLGLYDREPASFPATAARWGARLTIEKRLALPDAQLTFAALGMLPSSDAELGAEALVALAERHRLLRVEKLLTGWLRVNRLVDGPEQRPAR